MLTTRNKVIVLGFFIWSIPIIVLLCILVWMQEQQEKQIDSWGESSIDFKNSQSPIFKKKLMTKSDNKPLQINSKKLKEDYLWIVQIASFKNQKFAKVLVKNLKVKGYFTVIKEIKVNEEIIYAVRLKTFDDYDFALKTVQFIKEDFQGLLPIVFNLSTSN